MKTLEAGDPGEVLTAAGWQKPPRTCSVAGCAAAHVSKGLCRRHRSQVERHGRLTPELERRPRPCLAPTCDGRRAELGPYCRRHAHPGINLAAHTYLNRVIEVLEGKECG